MKVRNYERTSIVYFLVILLLFIEMIGIIILITLKTYSYKKISGIVAKENVLVLMLNDDQKKIIYKNQNAYIDNYCKKYKIIENKGKLFSKGKNNYYEIVIDINFSKKYKPNDVIDLSIKDKKYHLIEMFKIIWDGDKYSNN
jgi:hypothetical protein